MPEATLRTGGVAAMLMMLSSAAGAQEAPRFMQETLPDGVVTAAFEEFQAVMEDGALDRKTKELIGISVAAQVPCEYCVFYHSAAARAFGATEAEIKEAVTMAALVRQWSTMLNGSDYDMDRWRAEVESMFDGDAGE